MNSRILSFATAFVSVIFNVSYGQTAPEKNFTEKLEGIQSSSKELTKNMSSDNASVGQGGEMSTSIPLVTVTSRTMSFPVQLNYASGIKVDQQSGSVGLGWNMSFGSIVRDYGSFEPDYTATNSELSLTQNNWINTVNSSEDINPFTHHEGLDYNMITGVEDGMSLNDLYHVSIPGVGGNTFWNGGATIAAHDWRLTDADLWKIEHTKKTFVIDQEYSRINEYNRNHCINCNDKTHFGTDGSYAAAIAVLPYVINGKAYKPSSSAALWPQKVEYEDFSSFTITDENGFRYVFGRALRGQKYLFSDNPYWSTSASPDADNVGNDGPKGSFWKIDYIAEWLLTEILSPDYEDLNNNGIADDGDAGDWIRFEYTEATQVERVVPISADGFMTSIVPKHRQWNSFSQTDRASSLMRELAYLERIVTPVQTIDFTISERYDVDHDYFGKPANKYGNSFYYEDRHFTSSGSNGSPSDLDIHYPVETMKYDTIKVYSKLIDKINYPTENTLTGAIVLNYAAKGSSKELAVSEYLIRNNNDVAKKKVNGQDLGTPSDTQFNVESYKNGTDKRGKTTLLGVDLFGGDMNPNEKTSYTFEYAYNPSYNEIHKRAIIRAWAFPSVRQSETNDNTINYKATALIPSYNETRLGSNGTSYTSVNHPNIHPNEFLINFPFKEKYYKFSNFSTSDITDFITSNPSSYPFGSKPQYSEDINHPLKPVEDEFGYFYAEGCEVCPEAWSLTKIIYPTGGQVTYDYERAPYDTTVDRANWSFDETNVPIVQQYNHLAKRRSLGQDVYNQSSLSIYGNGFPLKTLTATYEIDVPDYCGIRLKSKSVNDRINPEVTVNYEYGTLHYSALPADLLQNYYEGFNNFIIRERNRHQWEYRYSIMQYFVAEIPLFFVDFDERMSHAAHSNISIDNYTSTYFYDQIDTKYSDLSFVRNHYGSIDHQNGITSGIYPIYSAFGLKNMTADHRKHRYALGGTPILLKPIVNYKTEWFEANTSLPYKTEQTEYELLDLDSRSINFTVNAKTIYNNSFEFWLPIRDNFSPHYYSTVSNIDLGPFSAPGTVYYWDDYYGNANGKSFAYHKNHLMNVSTITHMPTGHFTKWRSSKLLVKSKSVDYKGLVTSKEYTYNNLYQLISEKTSGNQTDDEYYTTYEYADETYGVVSTIFDDKNIYTAITRVNSYYGPVQSSNAISAQMTTYDITSYSVPRPNHTYVFETNNVTPNGTFTLSDFVLNGSNVGWRITPSENLEYNKKGMPHLAQNNRLFSKTVFGNNQNMLKASFLFPDYAFDATYTGFEDLQGKYILTDWTNQDYKDEKWFSAFESELDEPAYSAHFNENICGINLPNPLGTCPLMSRYLNFITVDNVTNLVVGDVVEVELTGSSNSVPSNYSWSAEVEITDILNASDYTPSLSSGNPLHQYINDYVLCFSEPIEFPESSLILGGSCQGVSNPHDESAWETISETKVTKKLRDHYKLSKGYKRTGNYSCQLRSKRSSTDAFTQTPIRPVKIYEDYESACSPEPIMMPDGSILYPFIPNYCYRNYEASLWLIHSSDIPTVPAQGTVPPTSNDPNADAIYRRGTVSETNNSSGFKIVCDIYNADRSALIEQKVFYPDGVDGNWRQYTVNFNMDKQSDKWVDVYVVNERDQTGQPFINLKSLFVDDILIYPKGAKYSYSTVNKFGEVTFSSDNNDAFVKNVFDEKGRPINQANVYGTITTQRSYYEHPVSWSSQNNHITERNWVDNGVYNEIRYYLDGFGKTKQKMVSDITRNARIVGETNIYDSKGQVIRSYKPYALKNSGLTQKFDGLYESKTQELYNSNFAYTSALYEAKPESIISSISEPRTNAESAIVSTQSDYLNAGLIQNTALNYNFLPGQLLVHEVINAQGARTRTYLDNLSRVVMEEHQIGQSHIQNSDGSVTIDALSTDVYARTWFQYDKAGRLTDVWDPENKHSHYVYNSLGILIESNTPDKGTSRLRYDEYGQVRFVQNQKDIAASVIEGMNQFNYTKYDVWGRVSESGMLIANSNCTTCPVTDYFNASNSINDQEFPLAANKLVQVHARYTFDGERAQFNSHALLEERVYSNHQMNGAFLYSADDTDMKRYFYMADGQLAKVEYEYNGLTGSHTFTNEYNAMRLPKSKHYTHPSNAGYNFEWISVIDNFGRPKENKTKHNNIVTTSGNYYYDVLGNLLMKGIGSTGNPNGPNYDYLVTRKNIRDQVVMSQSKSLRVGLEYNAIGNITAQTWSNDYFDGGTSVNRYNYYYDKMNRLIGADYLAGSFTSNPFTAFTNLVTNIPTDFVCNANMVMMDAVIDPVIADIERRIEEGDGGILERDAINNLNQLKVQYRNKNATYSTLNENEQDEFLTDYYTLLDRERLDPVSYELMMAIQEKDGLHEEKLLKNPFSIHLFKYTHLLLSSIPYEPVTDCNPNEAATVYGMLPTFPNPSAISNTTKYDAAYWYEKNGNIVQLNRNNEAGDQMMQEYQYSTANNQLEEVAFTDFNNSFMHAYEYEHDVTGNLLSDERNGVLTIEYIPYNDMPQSITNGTGTKTYRYDATGIRTVKISSPTDKNYYLDGVVLNADGNVLSYQTVDGYANAYPNGSGVDVMYFYYLKDWLGTVRGVMDDAGTIVNAADHYPYGLRMPNRAFVSDVEGNRYQFTGHEHDGETNYDYHGARYYNAELGRYLSVDQLAIKSPNWTPYRYCFDNPINYLDIDGRFETRKEARQYKKEHNIEGVIRKDSDGEGFNVSNKYTGQEWHKGTKWEIENDFTNDEGIVEGAIAVAKNSSKVKRSGRTAQITANDRARHLFTELQKTAIGNNIVGIYGEYTSSSVVGGGAVGVLMTRYGVNTYGTSSQIDEKSNALIYSFKTELFSLGFEGGYIFSTGPASEVPLSAFEGISNSVEVSASAVFVDAGVQITDTRNFPYNENGDYLIIIGFQVSGGIGTPFATAGFSQNNTIVK